MESLSQSRDRESNKEAKKALKKRLDSMRKELREVEGQISETESILGYAGSGGARTALPHGDLDAIVEEVTVEEGDAQARGTTQESTAPSPRREEEQPMEVHPLPAPYPPQRMTY